MSTREVKDGIWYSGVIGFKGFQYKQEAYAQDMWIRHILYLTTLTLFICCY